MKQTNSQTSPQTHTHNKKKKKKKKIWRKFILLILFGRSVCEGEAIRCTSAGWKTVRRNARVRLPSTSIARGLCEDRPTTICSAQRLASGVGALCVRSAKREALSLPATARRSTGESVRMRTPPSRGSRAARGAPRPRLRPRDWPNVSALQMQIDHHHQHRQCFPFCDSFRSSVLSLSLGALHDHDEQLPHGIASDVVQNN
jgi:hypothetical protein